MRNIPRDLPSGISLIAGALLGLLVMAFHPTGHDLARPGQFGAMAHLNVAVHSLALFATPLVFFGLLGVARRLSPSALATAALVAFGFNTVAMLGAAVASGFVATEVIERSLSADPAAQELYHTLLWYTGRLNQGFARVGVFASSAGLFLAGLSILRHRRMPRSLGILGLAVGLLTALMLAVGHLRLDVHGFGAVVLAQAVWLVWAGGLLCREGSTPDA
ncbi:MAG: hypothetical protein U0002_09295 [Thermoanaerobaculia bacterium]